MTETTTPAGFTLTEAAEATNKSRVTLRRWLDEGRFPNATQDVTDPNLPWRIPVQDLVSAGATVHKDPETDTAMTQAMVVELAVQTALAKERLEALERTNVSNETINRLLDRLDISNETINRLLDRLDRLEGGEG